MIRPASPGRTFPCPGGCHRPRRAQVRGTHAAPRDALAPALGTADRQTGLSPLPPAAVAGTEMVPVTEVMPVVAVMMAGMAAGMMALVTAMVVTAAAMVGAGAGARRRTGKCQEPNNSQSGEDHLVHCTSPCDLSRGGGPSALCMCHYESRATTGRVGGRPRSMAPPVWHAARRSPDTARLRRRCVAPALVLRGCAPQAAAAGRASDFLTTGRPRRANHEHSHARCRLSGDPGYSPC